MTDEPPNETSTDDELKDLDDRLRAAEARQKRKTVDSRAETGANKGYETLGVLLGGILTGLGLGWLVDNYMLHSLPFGMVAGVILGLVASIYTIVKQGRTGG